MPKAHLCSELVSFILRKTKARQKLTGPDKFSRQSKVFLTPTLDGSTPSKGGARNPKSKRPRTSARKSHEFLSPFAIATPCCQQNFRYFSPPRRAERGAPDSRGYRSPSLSASVLLAGSPSPLAAAARVQSTPPRSPASHHLRNPPNPTSTEANHISASVLFVGVEIHTGVG
ncbi:hypothetical protein BDA96_07G168100 [Sorghum bicolor]|uniref:Uncharacterized protein n=1 Tax=Sorghum bicolor TaxID=4558 RepID=A0A921QNH5_SORBI|nr:hypothetical protein BDA96_07G168100 [Sorghum bicolor]